MARKVGWTSAKKLVADALGQGPLYFGLIKEADGDDNLLLFSHGSRCGNWIKIPASSVKDVDFIRMVPCEGHEHPFVRLRLAPPQHPEGELFAKLAVAMSPAVQPVGTSPIALGLGQRSRAGWCWDELNHEWYPGPC